MDYIANTELHPRNMCISSIKALSCELGKRDTVRHNLYLPHPNNRLSQNIVQRMVIKILELGYVVVGSALTTPCPSDIDVHIPNLKNIYSDVYMNIVEAFDHIEFGAFHVRMSMEKSNIPYGENIYCRYLILVTVYMFDGLQKEIIIDITDGNFMPPVYSTNTVQAMGNIYVPNYNTHGNVTLEKLMEMVKDDKSEINPHSVLHGRNIISILDGIRRINDTIKKKKFGGGVKYNDTVEVIMSKENICEPIWCNCNHESDIYHYLGIDRVFIKLQCCGTIVCADLLTNNIKALFKAQLCPFSTTDDYHFIQFRHDNFLEYSNKTLITKLNKYWDILEHEYHYLSSKGVEETLDEDKPRKQLARTTERDDDWYRQYRGIKNMTDVPIFDIDLYRNIDTDTCTDDMPELENISHDYKETLDTDDIIDENNQHIPTHTDHVLIAEHIDDECNMHAYKAKCFQVWASCMVETYTHPEYLKLDIGFKQHATLNI